MDSKLSSGHRERYCIPPDFFTAPEAMREAVLEFGDGFPWIFDATYASMHDCMTVHVRTVGGQKRPSLKRKQDIWRFFVLWPGPVDFICRIEMESSKWREKT